MIGELSFQWTQFRGAKDKSKKLEYVFLIFRYFSGVGLKLKYSSGYLGGKKKGLDRERGISSVVMGNLFFLLTASKLYISSDENPNQYTGSFSNC